MATTYEFMKAKDLLTAVSDAKTTAEKFVIATVIVDYVKDPLKLGLTVNLEFLGLYKQGLYGDCKDPNPKSFNPKTNAKWQAWNDATQLCNKRKQTKSSQEYAQLVYIDKGKGVIFKRELDIDKVCIDQKITSEKFRTDLQRQKASLIALQTERRSTHPDSIFVMLDTPKAVAPASASSPATPTVGQGAPILTAATLAAAASTPTAGAPASAAGAMVTAPAVVPAPGK